MKSPRATRFPLYRQSQIYGREDVPLERSTLTDCVRRSTNLLEPLADTIGRHVMAGAAIHAVTQDVEKVVQVVGRRIVDWTVKNPRAVPIIPRPRPAAGWSGHF